jgi:hypothetical protein
MFDRLRRLYFGSLKKAQLLILRAVWYCVNTVTFRANIELKLNFILLVISVLNNLAQEISDTRLEIEVNVHFLHVEFN